ncbi:MAG: polysaccharide deacetylase [bacterium]|nr:polysaccharide deacetylase [bacterium]
MDDPPIWAWPFEQIRKITTQAHAGADLTPRVWPTGARAAVALSFDFDGETSWLYRGGRSPAAMSRGEYGARVGVHRILSLLARHEVPATFFVPAVNGQLHPDAIDAILQSGRHEIGVHGWIHERGQDLTAEVERELLTRAFDYWRTRVGHNPAGIRTPSWDFTAHTLGIIKDLGFIYDSSLMGDDRPYELCVDNIPTGIVELPVEWLLDDHPFLQIDPTNGSRSTMHPGALLEIWRSEFQMAYEERTLFLLTMHPQVIGHRSRLKMLETLVEEIRSTPGIWFATHEAVAQVVRAEAAKNGQ